MIRVGILHRRHGAAWLGGARYFRNLLTALFELPERRVEPVMLTDGEAPSELLADVPRLLWAGLPSLQRDALARAAARLARAVMRRDAVFERDLRAAGIRVLSHSGHLGPGASIPTLAWIEDFQHVRLPQMFGPLERNARNREYRAICRFATRVLVSSASAQEDLAAFDADAHGRSRVLRFVAAAPDPATVAPRAMLEQKYGFKGGYFFLPNQFWVHKNHRIVIEALALLKARRTAVTVLACGTPADRRNPRHFESLAARARELGVEALFRPLGIIPGPDLAALMWHSLALINPSRFEGWSTTVEEAKSLGVPVILSDIAVHREQQPPCASYFDPDDAAALASAMERCREEPESAARQELARSARKRLPTRRAEFARCFEDYVLECAGSA